MAATRWWIARLVVAVLVLAGAGLVAPSSASAAPPEEVEAFLSGLPRASEGSMSGYSRDLFPHWIDNNGDCQDTRDEVLAWESTVTPGYDSGGCNVVSGRWWSAYDNQTLTSPSSIQIDHMIPLAEAWRSGAASWSTTSRRSFANDLSAEETLRAVSGSSNGSKSDRDPSEWLPPNTSFRCQYLKEWVWIKDRWNLSVDTAEYNALFDGLLPCSL
jgi:Protein of unknown function (DUF1524)